MRPQKCALKNQFRFHVNSTMTKQNQRSQTRLDSMRADVCLIKAYPFDASIWEMAHCTSCVFKLCVCVRIHLLTIPSPLCLRLHCMSPSLSQTKTNRALWSLHTHIPTTHPSINPHAQCTYSSQTPTPPTHTLSDMHLAHKNQTYTHLSTFT